MSHHSRRRGTVLIGVVACIVICTLLTGMTVQSALRGRREARLERQRLQTEWLVEGGLVRAVNALRKSTEYVGETWKPELSVEPLRDAEVEIKVERANESQVAWTIKVVARLDSNTDNDGPMQRSGTLTVKPF